MLKCSRDRPIKSSFYYKTAGPEDYIKLSALNFTKYTNYKNRKNTIEIKTQGNSTHIAKKQESTKSELNK